MTGPEMAAIAAAVTGLAGVIVNAGVWYRLGRIEGRFDELTRELHKDLNGIAAKVREVERRIA